MVCSALKKKNKQERSGQRSLFDAALQPWERVGTSRRACCRWTNWPTIRSRACAASRRGMRRWWDRAATNTAACGPIVGARPLCGGRRRTFPYPVTEEVFRSIEHNPFDIAPWMREEIERLAGEYQFFHWHLEFPEVFAAEPRLQAVKTADPGKDADWEWGGFDVVLSNPPWER